MPTAAAAGTVAKNPQGKECPRISQSPVAAYNSLQIPVQYPKKYSGNPNIGHSARIRQNLPNDMKGPLFKWFSLVIRITSNFTRWLRFGILWKLR